MVEIEPGEAPVDEVHRVVGHHRDDVEGEDSVQQKHHHERAKRGNEPRLPAEIPAFLSHRRRIEARSAGYQDDIDMYILYVQYSHMNWSIAEARKRFSELVRKAQDEPQVILRRQQRVAVLVDSATYDELESLRRERAERTIGEAATALREVCAAEAYDLVVSERRDRATPFDGDNDDPAR